MSATQILARIDILLLDRTADCITLSLGKNNVLKAGVAIDGRYIVGEGKSLLEAFSDLMRKADSPIHYNGMEQPGKAENPPEMR